MNCVAVAGRGVCDGRWNGKINIVVQNIIEIKKGLLLAMEVMQQPLKI